MAALPRCSPLAPPGVQVFKGHMEQHPPELTAPGPQHIWGEWGRGVSTALHSHPSTRMPLWFPVSTAVCPPEPFSHLNAHFGLSLDFLSLVPFSLSIQMTSAHRTSA